MLLSPAYPIKQCETKRVVVYIRVSTSVVIGTTLMASTCRIWQAVVTWDLRPPLSRTITPSVFRGSPLSLYRRCAQWPGTLPQLQSLKAARLHHVMSSHWTVSLGWHAKTDSTYWRRSMSPGSPLQLSDSGLEKLRGQAGLQLPAFVGDLYCSWKVGTAGSQERAW